MPIQSIDTQMPILITRSSIHCPSIGSRQSSRVRANLSQSTKALTISRYNANPQQKFTISNPTMLAIKIQPRLICLSRHVSHSAKLKWRWIGRHHANPCQIRCQSNVNPVTNPHMSREQELYMDRPKCLDGRRFRRSIPNQSDNP